MDTEKTVKQIRFLSVALIIYGMVCLAGIAGSYEDFSRMYSPLNGDVIRGLYYFSFTYGVLSVLCGLRIMKYENWARITSVMLTLSSLVIGVFVMPTVIKNLKSAMSAVTADQGDINSIVAISAFFTLFEIFFVYFFTRNNVVRLFSK